MAAPADGSSPRRRRPRPRVHAHAADAGRASAGQARRGGRSARARRARTFDAEFGGAPHDTVEALCADPDVDAVYVATPHELPRARTPCPARAHGKHVLVEKPMALTLAECDAMIDAARARRRARWSSATATASTRRCCARAS